MIRFVIALDALFYLDVEILQFVEEEKIQFNRQ